MIGFLTLGRSFFSHPLWVEERPYSRAEAWLDFLQTAAFAETKRLIAGTMIEIPRGGLVASVRYLSDRWKWSNTKVCQFLDMLEAELMIHRQKRQGYTLILLCNFERFNSEKRQENDDKTTRRRRGDDKEEEGKQDKQGKEAPSRSTNIPDVLGSIPGFSAEWDEYRLHRRKIRAPMTPHAEDLILRKLVQRPHIALRAVQEAISANWRGFEWEWLENRCPKMFQVGRQNSAGKTANVRERVNAQLVEYHEWLRANYDPEFFDVLHDPLTAKEPVLQQFIASRRAAA